MADTRDVTELQILYKIRIKEYNILFAKRALGIIGLILLVAAVIVGIVLIAKSDIEFKGIIIYGISLISTFIGCGLFITTVVPAFDKVSIMVNGNYEDVSRIFKAEIEAKRVLDQLGVTHLDD